MKQDIRTGLIGATVALACIAIQAGAQSTNTIPYGESFEGYTNGQYIVSATNGWYGAEDAAVAFATNFIPSAGFPLGGLTNEMVLELVSDTTNLVDGLSYASSTNLWVDLLVRPRRWDDETAPGSLPSDAQMALFVDSNGFLNIYHTILDFVDPAYGDVVTQQWSVVTDEAFQIPSNEWVRVSIQMDYSTPAGIASFFRVLINGEEVTHTNAFADPQSESFSSGAWFAMAKSDASQINALNLRGTGYFDDIVINDTTPSISNTIYRTITASAVGGGMITPSGDVEVAENANQEFTWVADAGYEIEGTVAVDGGITTNMDASVTNYTFVAVTTNGTITAYFKPAGTGNWTDWLGDAGLEEGADPNGDPDGDLSSNLEEHIASTHPTNGNFRFEVSNIWKANGTNYVQWYSIFVDTNLPPFGIQATTNLMEDFALTGSYQRVAGTGDEIVTNTWSEAAPAWPVYYRVVATNNVP